MTGGVAAYLVAAYEHIAGHSLTAFVWVTLGIALFMVGAFLAWNEQFNKAILAGNPEIVIEYEKSAKHITAPLFVKNLGGGNAYRVKIRDITNDAGAVVRFSEVSNLESKQMYEAKGSFENFKEFAPFFSHNYQQYDGSQDNHRNRGLLQRIRHAVHSGVRDQTLTGRRTYVVLAEIFQSETVATGRVIKKRTIPEAIWGLMKAPTRHSLFPSRTL